MTANTWRGDMTFDIPEVNALTQRMDSLESLLAEMIIRSGERSTVTVEDVCRIEGVSRSQVRLGGAERYLLPRFGESAYPTGKTRWPIEEFMAWRKRPPEERAQEYRRKLIHEAREMQKKKAN